MSVIADIRGREIIDSRGNPTVEADVAAGTKRPKGNAKDDGNYIVCVE